jgi:hypothetical protein
MTTSEAWHPSALFRVLAAMMVTYTNPNAHYQMESDLAAMVWDLKGVGPSKVTWDKLIREYDAFVTGTSHLDLPLQVPRLTWKEGWFTVFKSRVPQWALKVSSRSWPWYHFNTMAIFWTSGQHSIPWLASGRHFSVTSRVRPSLLVSMASLRLTRLFHGRNLHSRPYVMEIFD